MFRIKASNFLTFDELEFDFTNKGLCLIQGDNKDETLQKSNGAGKTNLVDALCWGLYGESLKGKSPDKVVNLKTGKDCCVEVAWNDCKVIRYRKHKKFKNDLQFYIGGEDKTAKSNKDTQQLINEAIGLNYDSFIKSVYFQQSTLNSFAAAKDSEQKAIIEDILSLNVLTLAQEVAKDKVKGFQKEIDSFAQAMALVNAKVADTRSRALMLRQRSAQFENEREQDTKMAKTKLAVLETKKQEQTSDFNMAQAEMLVAAAEPVAQAIPAMAQAIQQLQTQRLGVLQQQNEAAFRIRTSNQRINELDSQYQKFITVVEARKCPTCGQAVEDVKKLVVELDWKGEIEKEREKIKVFATEQDAVAAKLKEVDATIQQNQAELLKKQQLMEMANQMKQKIAQEQLRLKEMAMIDERITEQKQRLAEIMARLNPFTEQLNEESAKVEKAEGELKLLTDQITSFKQEKAYYDYWVDGLGNQKLKSYIMESITPILNERANYYSQFLTGGAFQIDISTQTVLKSGEVREKFSVNVAHQSGADYELSSGGERKRIDICILLALQDLVGSRASQPIPLLIMDEVSENLDDIGVERMLELLHTITSQKGTCLYVTHHEGMKPLFPNTITVTKQNGISKVTA